MHDLQCRRLSTRLCSYVLPGAAGETDEDVFGSGNSFDFNSFVEGNQALHALKMTLAPGFDNAVLRVDEHTKAARDKYHHLTHLINKKKAREAAGQQAADGISHKHVLQAHESRLGKCAVTVSAPHVCLPITSAKLKPGGRPLPAGGPSAQVEQGAGPAGAEPQDGPNDGTCCICLDTIDEMTMTICGHQFCTECIRLCVERTSRCPQCRTR
jgi:hypothetical protein